MKFMEVKRKQNWYIKNCFTSFVSNQSLIFLQISCVVICGGDSWIKAETGVSVAASSNTVV